MSYVCTCDVCRVVSLQGEVEMLRAKLAELEAKLLRFQCGEEIESDYLTRKDDEILRLMNEVAKLREVLEDIWLERTVDWDIPHDTEARVLAALRDVA